MAYRIPSSCRVQKKEGTQTSDAGHGTLLILIHFWLFRRRLARRGDLALSCRLGDIRDHLYCARQLGRLRTDVVGVLLEGLLAGLWGLDVRGWLWDGLGGRLGNLRRLA